MSSVQAESPLQKQPVLWVLVADGARARIFHRQRSLARIPMAGNGKQRHYDERYGDELIPVPGMEWEADSPQRYEIGNDQLGRAFDSVGMGRHMVSPRIDTREELKLRFMKTLAEKLQHAAREKSFDQLVLSAPPKLLGELKKQLDKTVLARVVAELPKDLTHHEAPALAAQLRDVA